MKTSSLSLVILIFALYMPLAAEAEPGKPEKVYRLTRVSQPKEWYIEQAQLWKKEIDKNPKNAEAWYNYYFATRYSVEFNRTKLNQIILDMEKSIPDTYEYLYTKYINDEPEPKDITLLQRAHGLRPNRSEHYVNFAHFYELNGEHEKARSYLEKLYESGYIASSWVNFNYNALMSTEDNAILFTNADYDTYPAWMLQQAKGIRSDVTVLNIFLSRLEPYLMRVLEEKNIKINPEDLPKSDEEDWLPELCKALYQDNPGIPIYFAVTVPRKHIKALEDNLYLVGLAYQYSNERIDNLALLAKNVKKHFRLDYLRYDWYGDTDVSKKSIHEGINLSYIIPFMTLYSHYKIGGENEKADLWKNFSLDLARKGNSKRMINYIKNRG